jgi:hypothetical protein
LYGDDFGMWVLIVRMWLVLEGKKACLLKDDGVKGGSENWIGFLSTVAITTTREVDRGDTVWEFWILSEWDRVTYVLASGFLL